MAARRDEGTPLVSTVSRPSLFEEKMMSQRTLQWTSVRSPATSLSDALEEKLTDVEALEQGIRVTKVTTRGAFKKRVITLSKDKYAIFVTHQKLKDKGTSGFFSNIASTLPLPVISRKGLVGFTNEKSLRDRFVRYIDVSDIDYVSWGVVGTQKLEYSRTTNRLKGGSSMVDQNRKKLVTIGHHGNQTLDIIVPSENEKKQLVQCLKTMQEVYEERKQGVSNEALLLRYIWYDVDVDQDGKIGEAEFLKILSRINFFVKTPSKAFRDFVETKYSEEIERMRKAKEDDEEAEDVELGLTYSEVMELLQILKAETVGTSVPDQLWSDIFGEEEKIVTATDFLEKFIRGAQHDKLSTIEDVEHIFSTINALETNIANEPKDIIFNRHLSRERFSTFLHHQINSAYDPWSMEKDEKLKLDKPMSEYWINTSHNTYLTGDQLQSSSSVEMYMKALLRGCKCLELDCWDGETVEGRYYPVVFHGHTLTSKILFADIIRVVKNYVRQNRYTYPIILSLENHCTHPFQTQIAEDLKTILGKLLYTPKEEDTKGLLPSPDSLRGRVVIKGKRPPEPDDAAIEETADNEEDPYADEGETGDAPSLVRKKESASKPPKIVKELADLTLFDGTKYKQFSKSILEPPSRMHSISEPKIAKILNKSPTNSTMWRQYNVQHMTRTYPAGARVDSSNYNPILPWALGCQLVALNFQTCDSPLILNDGLFRQNGGCGYVLKPHSVMPKPTTGADDPAFPPGYGDETTVNSLATEDHQAAVGGCNIICGPQTESNPPSADPEPVTEETLAKMPSLAERMRVFQQILKDRIKPLRIRVRILSGSCLPKPGGEKTGETIDPYVTVTLHDIKKEENGKLVYETSSHTTATVQDNGFCPIWSEKTPREFIVNSPQVAMLHFSLKEKDIGLDDKVADAAIPISLLRKGYRSIQLFDKNGSRTGAFGFATLLVDIQRYELV